MNNKFHLYLISTLSLLLLSSDIGTTQLVKCSLSSSGCTSDPGLTFASPVSSKVYDRATGTLFLGLNATGTTIYKAVRPIGNEAAVFTAMTNATTAVDNMTEATYLGNQAPYLGYSTADTSVLHALRYNNTGTASISNLVDASAPQPKVTQGILALAGMLNNPTQGFFFATVMPNAGYFGNDGTGVAVVALSSSDAISATIQMIQTAADSAFPSTVKAKPLNNTTTTELRMPTTNTLVFTLPPNMYWDNYLQRLYIGLQVAETGGGKDVIVGRVSSTGVLDWSTIVANDAVPVIANAIIACDDTAQLDAYFVRVMHCSTGPSYLIVVGGASATGNHTTNTVFALPLLDTPNNAALHGTIAAKNSPLVNGKFVTPASATDPMPLSTDIQAQVGSGALPIANDTNIADIEVIGDTVYVSIAGAKSATKDNGIFYSQAQFDKDGKVASWTPWTKTAFPSNAFYQILNIDSGVSFFAIDAVTGKVWAVDGNTRQTVLITAWDRGASCTRIPPLCPVQSSPCCTTAASCSCSCKPCCCPCPPAPPSAPCPNLTAKVSAALPDGSFSVLDLDQSTRGFYGALSTNPNLNRFALFGGTGTVVIARTSVATGPNINSPQIVIDNFDDPANFLVTKLPDPTACVKVLEYSRHSAADTVNLNFFYAGTDKGLFVFSKKDGSGFAFDELNLPTLAQGVWRLVPEFTSSITDIKTLGYYSNTNPNGLYIVTTDVGLASTLYRVPFAGSGQALFTTKYILAQSGVGIFDDVILFTGIRPVITNLTGTPPTFAGQQIVLTTNYGLFGSTRHGTTGGLGIDAATNQTEAAWISVPDGNTTMFYGIAGVYSLLPTTVWPFSVEDACGFCTFEASSIYQLSVSINTIPIFNGFVPPFFNAIDNSPAFASLYPITYFWSDGARRFFIINRPQDPPCQNKLMSFPYNTIEWGICNPANTVILFDPVVAMTPRFYWVQQIGVTGILMAGTSSGVISLE